MKLRLLKQSVRVRLTQPEVHLLGQGQPVVAELILGPKPEQKLIYSLEPRPDTESLGITMVGQHMVITLPEALGHELAQTDRVTLQDTVIIDPETSVTLCIEKDFQCLKPRSDEQDEDSFPNPASSN